MHIEGPVPAVMQLPRLVTFPFWKWTWKSCKAEVGIVLVPEVLFFFPAKSMWHCMFEALYEREVMSQQEVIGAELADLDRIKHFWKGRKMEGFSLKFWLFLFFKEEIIKVQLLWWKEVWHFPTLGSETICVFSWFQHSIPFAGTRRMVD